MTDDPSRLGEHLRTRALGRAFEHYETIGSTNDRALDWAKQGAPHGAVVTADRQTSGRGRRGRSWVSPLGGLYASVLVRPAAVGPSVGALGLAVAVGLREGLGQPGIGLKWPNDLLVDGHKLAGVLCEARWQETAAELVIGFGINVRRFETPAEVLATSLEALGATDLSRASLLARILQSLEDTLEQFFEGGFEAIRERYEAHSLVLGRHIEIDDPAGPGRRRVYADSFDTDGALRVRARRGAALERIEAADVWV